MTCSSLEIPACAAGDLDSFEVSIDGVRLFWTDNYDPVCFQTGYVEHQIDVSSFADGASHVLTFVRSTRGAQAVFRTSGSPFFVDDVTLVVCP